MRFLANGARYSLEGLRRAWDHFERTLRWVGEGREARRPVGELLVGHEKELVRARMFAGGAEGVGQRLDNVLARFARQAAQRPMSLALVGTGEQWSYGDLAAYAKAHRRIGRLPDTMTALVLGLERRPRLRRRAICALAAEPALFSRLLGIHGRTLPPRRLGLDGALRLAWRLVAA